MTRIRLPRAADGAWFYDGLPGGWRGRIRRFGPFARPEGWRYCPGCDRPRCDQPGWQLEVLGRWGLARPDDRDQVRAWVGGAMSEYPEDFQPTPPAIPPAEGGESR